MHVHTHTHTQTSLGIVETPYEYCVNEISFLYDKFPRHIGESTITCDDIIGRADLMQFEA